ncbi:hypothetical protein ABK905_08760 [Acerihabitans sp. KWT182]|uniref:Uncharacterized protein n=1 Tax=Acerihabitans sp. KWT182 TaxID=3157919 RepID=A0AAU7QD39_9GAMM
MTIIRIDTHRIISSYPDVFAKAQRIVKVKQQKSEQHTDKKRALGASGGKKDANYPIMP